MPRLVLSVGPVASSYGFVENDIRGYFLLLLSSGPGIFCPGLVFSDFISVYMRIL